MEKGYESVEELLVKVFQQEQTALLTLERICAKLSQIEGVVDTETSGQIPIQMIPKRKISQILLGSDEFVIAKTGSEVKWALRPKTPISLSDSSLTATIEAVLCVDGPMTIKELAHNISIPGIDDNVLQRYFEIHANEFSQQSSAKWWFADQPTPDRVNYESIEKAVEAALTILEEASADQIYWLLCLSAVNDEMITRAQIIYQLTHNPELYEQPIRAKYRLLPKITFIAPASAPHSCTRRSSIPIEPSDRPFSPEMFFSITGPYSLIEKPNILVM